MDENMVRTFLMLRHKVEDGGYTMTMDEHGGMVIRDEKGVAVFAHEDGEALEQVYRKFRVDLHRGTEVGEPPEDTDDQSAFSFGGPKV